MYVGSERVAMIKPDSSIYYYHNDHLGTPLAMTNQAGQTVWAADYRPFGEAVIEAGATVTNNFRFPGQYYDEETGLHYNYNRYYDPATGRYISADPIGIEGGINLFAYVKNNPFITIDLDGTSLVVYGDFCGPGSRIPTGKASDPPVPDCVDEACRQHDICYAEKNTKWWLPIALQPSKLKCDRQLCKKTNNCKTSCKNISIKTSVNAYFLCPLIAPFGL